MRLWHYYCGTSEDELILQDDEDFLIFFKALLLFMKLFILFLYFLVDCQYELLIDLCCLMTLWKAVFCIFLYYYSLSISPVAAQRYLNKTHTGHSALCSMWLTAPVLA